MTLFFYLFLSLLVHPPSSFFFLNALSPFLNSGHFKTFKMLKTKCSLQDSLDFDKASHLSEVNGVEPHPATANTKLCPALS